MQNCCCILFLKADRWKPQAEPEMKRSLRSGNRGNSEAERGFRREAKTEEMKKAVEWTAFGNLQFYEFGDSVGDTNKIDAGRKRGNIDFVCVFSFDELDAEN